LFLRHAQCVLNADNTNLLTGSTYEADLWYADALIDSWIADCCSYDVTDWPRNRAGALKRTELKVLKS
jgi:hypothetical protein